MRGGEAGERSGVGRTAGDGLQTGGEGGSIAARKNMSRSERRGQILRAAAAVADDHLAAAGEGFVHD